MNNKVCISHNCTWKSRCDLYFRSTDEMLRQYILPESTADGCPYFTQIKDPPDVAWGMGADSND